MTPTFAGEIQLAGWSESHTGGCKVTFWLSSPDELAAFRTLTTRKGNTAGHRFMAALVEIGDDELPVQAANTSPEPVNKLAKNEQIEKPKIGPLAYWLVLRCNDPEFMQWLNRTKGYCVCDSAEAGEAVKEMLGVVSRKDIDGDPDTVALFHERIRGPYAQWCAARGVTQ